MAQIKRFISVLLAVIMLSSLTVVATVSADAAVSGNFEYTLEDGSTAEITGYKGRAASVVIPSVLNGYKVKSIGEKAFKGNKTMKSLVIGSSVTEIDEGAFLNCKKLSKVDLGNVEFISDEAFKNCTALKTIKIPDTLIGVTGEAFTGCKKLKKFSVEKNNIYFRSVSGVLVKKNYPYIVAYPEAKGKKYQVPVGIQGIGEGAFKGNKTLKRVVLKNDVSVISENAFDGCTNLNFVSFGKKVTEIKEQAFQNCSKLKNVKFSFKLRTIEDDAFLGCQALKKVTLPKKIDNIGKESLGYVRNKGRYQKVKGFAIVGFANSEAEIYAEENGFKFIKK